MYPDVEDDFPACPVCGREIAEWETCWQCGGEGGHHDCGEDCCCLRPEINVMCEECDGRGSYPLCSGLPHTDEEMENYRRGLEKEKQG